MSSIGLLEHIMNDKAASATTGLSEDRRRRELDRRNLGFLFRDTHRAFRRIMKARITPFRITVAMWAQLWELWEEDGLSQIEIARRVKLEKPSVAATIHQLELSGLIERRANPADKREKLVFLTKRAQALRGDMTAMARGINEDVLAEFSEEEAEELGLLLLRVNRIVNQLAGQVENGQIKQLLPEGNGSEDADDHGFQTDRVGLSRPQLRADRRIE